MWVGGGAKGLRRPMANFFAAFFYNILLLPLPQSGLLTLYEACHAATQLWQIFRYSLCKKVLFNL